METEFYWEIILKSGEVVDVKPQNAELIKRKFAAKEPIVTATRGIPFSEIADVRESGRPYSDQKLLEDSIRAFGEAEYNADGSVICKWVKKSVPRREWTKYYAQIPSYRLLNDKDSHVEIAFRVATCDIDPQKVQAVSDYDTARLNR